MFTSRKTIKRLSSLMLVAVLLVAFSTTAFAANTFTMSTQYPGVSAKPGESHSFNLDFYSPSENGEHVTLSASDLPDGFTGTFTGGNNDITELYIQQGLNTSAAKFQVTVPDEVEQGVYHITLHANGTTGSVSLPLSINVTETLSGDSALVTEYAQQEGGSGTAFSFSTTIQNNTPMEQNFNLSAKAPDGWTVTFAPSSDAKTQVAALSVAENDSQGLTISVTPPDTIEAGSYDIPISAISATQTLSDTLTVTITGKHDVSISTPSGRLSFDATANKETSVVLQVTNNGNVDLTNINLTSSLPADWTANFSESTIDLLEPGATKEITATVTPSKDSLSGDYLVTLTSANAETTDGAQFRVTVKTSTLWGFTGLAVIVVAGGCLYFVFRKYGRR